MTDADRTWPALDLSPASDLLAAALVDYETTALEECADARWRVFFASAGARDRASEGLRRDFPDLAITPLDVPDDNWAARSQMNLRAIRAGRIVVAPPWDVPAAPSEGERVIVIQPSMGFGTGHHATTRLCLLALQRLDLAGRAVIDVGTGSGVLALAASLLGASGALGFDDDADAIASARENAGLNPPAHASFEVADLRSTRHDAADVVVANLTGGLLVAASSHLRGLVAPGGCLVLSGLTAGEERDVIGAFPGLHVEHRAQEDEWMCLTLRS